MQGWHANTASRRRGKFDQSRCFAVPLAQVFVSCRGPPKGYKASQQKDADGTSPPPAKKLKQSVRSDSGNSSSSAAADPPTAADTSNYIENSDALRQKVAKLEKQLHSSKQPQAQGHMLPPSPSRQAMILPSTDSFNNILTAPAFPSPTMYQHTPASSSQQQPMMPPNANTNAYAHHNSQPPLDKHPQLARSFTFAPPLDIGGYDSPLSDGHDVRMQPNAASYVPFMQIPIDSGMSAHVSHPHQPHHQPAPPLLPMPHAKFEPPMPLLQPHGHTRSMPEVPSRSVLAARQQQEMDRASASLLALASPSVKPATAADLQNVSEKDGVRSASLNSNVRLPSIRASMGGHWQTVSDASFQAIDGRTDRNPSYRGSTSGFPMLGRERNRRPSSATSSAAPLFSEQVQDLPLDIVVPEAAVQDLLNLFWAMVQPHWPLLYRPTKATRTIAYNSQWPMLFNAMLALAANLYDPTEERRMDCTGKALGVLFAKRAQALYLKSTFDSSIQALQALIVSTPACDVDSDLRRCTVSGIMG